MMFFLFFINTKANTRGEVRVTWCSPEKWHESVGHFLCYPKGSIHWTSSLVLPCTVAKSPRRQFKSLKKDKLSSRLLKLDWNRACGTTLLWVSRGFLSFTTGEELSCVILVDSFAIGRLKSWGQEDPRDYTLTDHPRLSYWEMQSGRYP